MTESIILGIVISFSLAAVVAYFWVRGIDYMHRNHPDYKGNDLFGDFDEDDKDSLL
jgi:hypothetical protein